MRSILTGKALVLGVLAGITGAVAVLAACSSSSNTGTGSNGNGNGEGGTTQSGTCTNPTLSIVFSPMYSAYIPSSQHTFQIPAIVDGIDNSTVTWSADPSMVTLMADMDTGGTMITVNSSGMVQIVATSSTGACGVSTLNITPALDTDWDIGNARYNNGVPVNPACFPGYNDSGTYTNHHDGGVFPCPDAGPACTNCHGPTANSTVFLDIAHTPEQTGGFSDQDLTNIFVNGEVPGWPDGGAGAGYFDPQIVSYNIWNSFHRWTDIQGPQQKAMVVYLRSLTPSGQDGSANFGGHYDGGHHHHDGGFEGGLPGNDSGSGSNDAGSGSSDSGSKGD